jgi:tetratricopeptide (TPR) repeat protein
LVARPIASRRTSVRVFEGNLVMSQEMNKLGLRLERLSSIIKLTGRSSLVAAGVWSASAGLLVPHIVCAEEAATEAAADTSENSVLIATREAPTSREPGALPQESESGDALEPVSQIPDRTPDLADQTSGESDPSKFGQALARVARADQPVATNTPAPPTPPAVEGVNAEPAKFNDIQPGTSTKQDVLKAWQEPTNSTTTADGTVLTYQMAPFKSVQALITDETVSAIKIELQSGLAPKRLAKQLSLDKIDVVDINDDQGAALGQAYPERGVLFMYAKPLEAGADSQPSVTHVVIQPIDGNAFALRAESRLHGPYEQNIRDLSFALSLDPNLAQAHWLLADIYLATGQADKAEAESAAACDLDGENAAYELRHAEALKALGRYDDATHAVRGLLDREDVPPVVKAQALHEMARLAALGDATIAARAISFDNKAIEIADPLTKSKNVKERHAAKELLVAAHLSIGREVANHEFNNKLESVSQWIGRASGLAEDYIATDGGSLWLRLIVAKEGLAALASFKPTNDPEPFVAEAKEAADSLAQQFPDDQWQRRIKWELGQAYFQAVRIEHLRMQSAGALRYGQLAIDNLAAGAESRQAVFDSEQLVGELYFQIGAVHAVHKQDHKTAVEWYDKAAPLLTSPRPVSELLAPQRQGEELVSMGVSYWQIGEKDRAVDLTLTGADLVRKAVDSGVLVKSSLGVPYGNLATMYQQLGETQDAAKYAELARANTAEAAPDATTSAGGKSNAAKPRTANNIQRVKSTGQNGSTAQRHAAQHSAQRTAVGKPGADGVK